MKKFIGLVCFISALLCAAVSLTAILFTYLGPQIDIQQLLYYSTIARWIASSAFLFVFIIGFSASAIPYVRNRVSRWGIRIAIGRLPWYMRLCYILLIVAAFEFIFSSPGGIHLESGKWITGASHVLVSRSEAYELLRAGLRREAAMCLLLSLLWMLFAYSVVRNQTEGDEFFRASTPPPRPPKQLAEWGLIFEK